MTNLRQIVKRLPNYLVNKWGNASFAFREKGSTPRLSDLAKFVKRQAAIKNDPGFVSEKRPQKQTEPHTRPPTLRPKRQTDAFSTDFKTGRPNVDPQNNEGGAPIVVYAVEINMSLPNANYLKLMILTPDGGLLNGTNCAMPA